jgi:hypothetical protein
VDIGAVEVNCFDARMPKRSALGSHTRAMTYVCPYLQVWVKEDLNGESGNRQGKDMKFEHKCICTGCKPILPFHF